MITPAEIKAAVRRLRPDMTVSAQEALYVTMGNGMGLYLDADADLANAAKDIVAAYDELAANPA